MSVRDVKRIENVRRLNQNNLAQVQQFLRSVCTQSARRAIRDRIQAGAPPASLILLFQRIADAIDLENQGFDVQTFANSFRHWPIPGLEDLIDPYQADYHVRHLLERTFGCALAYNQALGLTIVSIAERNMVAEGRVENYQLPCPFVTLQEESTLQPQPLPPASITRAMVSWVKTAVASRQPTYSTDLLQRIEFYLNRGLYRSAALLVFRGQRAADVLELLRDESLINQMDASGLGSLLAETQNYVTSEEMLAGFLLRQLPVEVASFFIEDLARTDHRSAVRILGCVGGTARAIDRFSLGDMRITRDQSLVSLILSNLIVRGESRLVNRLVRRGAVDQNFDRVFEHALDELHFNFHESVMYAAAYQRTRRRSIFFEGRSPFEVQSGEQSTAMVRSGEAYLSPRVVFARLAAELVREGEFEEAWDIIVCGRQEAEAFFDLNQELTPPEIGRLLGSRLREDIARFSIEVLNQRSDFREGLASVLVQVYSEVADVAALFEYMIESDVVIANSRQTAYEVLYYGATTERVGDTSLNDRCQEVLVQIEEDKADAGWFSADVFIQEGRFLSTDPPTAVRTEQLKHYYAIMSDGDKPDTDRIYAARMMGRMGAVEYFGRMLVLYHRRRLFSDLFTCNLCVSLISIYGLVVREEKPKVSLQKYFEDIYLPRNIANISQHVFRARDELISNATNCLWFLIRVLDVPATLVETEEKERYSGLRRCEDLIDWPPPRAIVAAQILGEIRATAAVEHLRSALVLYKKYRRDKEGKCCIEALGSIGDPAAVPTVLSCFDSFSGSRELVIDTLARIGGVAALRGLVEIKDRISRPKVFRETYLERKIIKELSRFGPLAVEPLIHYAWFDKGISYEAIDSLGIIGLPAKKALVKLLQYQEGCVRSYAAKTLISSQLAYDETERMGYHVYVLTMEMWGSPEESVAAYKALRSIGELARPACLIALEEQVIKYQRYESNRENRGDFSRFRETIALFGQRVEKLIEILLPIADDSVLEKMEELLPLHPVNKFDVVFAPILQALAFLRKERE